MHVHIYIYICMYMCVCMYVYIHIYIYMYIWQDALDSFFQKSYKEHTDFWIFRKNHQKDEFLDHLLINSSLIEKSEDELPRPFPYWFRWGAHLIFLVEMEKKEAGARCRKRKREEKCRHSNRSLNERPRRDMFFRPQKTIYIYIYTKICAYLTRCFG